MTSNELTDDATLLTAHDRHDEARAGGLASTATSDNGPHEGGTANRSANDIGGRIPSVATLRDQLATRMDVAPTSPPEPDSAPLADHARLPGRVRPPGGRRPLRDGHRHRPVIDRPYVIKDLLMRGEVSVLYGPAGTGKSALMCLVATHVAAGLPMAGMRVRQGAVIYVATEAPGSVGDRAYVARERLRQPHDIPFAIDDNRIDLRDEDSVDDFIEHARLAQRDWSVKLAMVVVDTFALAIGDGDDCSQPDMAAATSGAQSIAMALDVHVCLVHHPGKDVDRGMRGSSVIRAAIFTEIKLERTSEPGILVGEVTKQKDGRDGQRIGFRLDAHVLGRDSDHDPRTVVVAELVEPPAKPKGGGSRGTGKSEGRFQNGPRDRASGGSGLPAEDTGARRLRELRLALDRRQSDPALSRVPFGPADLARAIEEGDLGAQSFDTRRRTVERLLPQLLDEPGAPIRRDGDRWLLTRPGSGVELDPARRSPLNGMSAS